MQGVALFRLKAGSWGEMNLALQTGDNKLPENLERRLGLEGLAHRNTVHRYLKKLRVRAGRSGPDEEEQELAEEQTDRDFPGTGYDPGRRAV